MEDNSSLAPTVRENLKEVEYKNSVTQELPTCSTKYRKYLLRVEGNPFLVIVFIEKNLISPEYAEKWLTQIHPNIYKDKDSLSDPQNIVIIINREALPWTSHGPQIKVSSYLLNYDIPKSAEDYDLQEDCPYSYNTEWFTRFIHPSNNCAIVYQSELLVGDSLFRNIELWSYRLLQSSNYSIVLNSQKSVLNGFMQDNVIHSFVSNRTQNNIEINLIDLNTYLEKFYDKNEN